MIPIVAVAVVTLARPGGNVTGLSVVSPDMATKRRLELLRELVPGLRRLAVLLHDNNSANVEETRQVRDAAAKFALEAFPIPIRCAEDIAPAFEGLKDRADGPLCRREPAHVKQHRSYQHLGRGRSTADELHREGVRSGRRALGLRTELRWHLPPRRRFLS